MSKSNTWENDLLLLVFNNTAVTLIGDAAGLQPSATAGSLYVSLHTADPTDTGDQSTYETVYTDYSRQPVARSGAGWTVSGNTVSNAALIQFPTCGVTGATVTHFGVGCSSGTGAGKLLYSGQLTAPLAVASGIQPQFSTGELDITED